MRKSTLVAQKLAAMRLTESLATTLLTEGLVISVDSYTSGVKVAPI